MQIRATIVRDRAARRPRSWLAAGTGGHAGAGIVGLVAAIVVSLGGLAPGAVGLAKREPWTSSRLHGPPTPPAPYRLVPAFPKLKFQNAVLLERIPRTRHLLIGELQGRLWAFREDPAVEQAELIVDLKRELPEFERLYGLAFHPEFPRVPEVFLCYITHLSKEDGTRVSRFRASEHAPLRLDLSSERVLLTWPSGGHNGGCLQFGPDGCLYISTGDASGPFPADVRRTGQRIDDLPASILRIDVDRRDPGREYAIPADNPFRERPDARPEVWCYGLRNPWRMSFDPVEGRLWIGDVGWEMWEMIYVGRPGANFGWSIIEGRQPVFPNEPRGPTPITPPTLLHPHTEARSITGGYVYRGQRLPELQGQYVYGDYVTGKVWAARLAKDDRVLEHRELLDSDVQVICFGIGHDSELYVVGYGPQGRIYRLERNTASRNRAPFPKRLSETGLFAETASHRLAPGVLTYSIIAEPWEDGFRAIRFIAVPAGRSIAIRTRNNPQRGWIRGEWAFPEGTVLGKTILAPTAGEGAPVTRAARTGNGAALPKDASRGTETGQAFTRGLRVETQLLHLHGDTWYAYSYRWTDDQTDAVFHEGAGELVTVGPSKPSSAERPAWYVASQTECLICHTSRAGTVLGFRPEQLNRVHDYGPVGGRVGDQLATLREIGLLTAIPESANVPMVSPRDAMHPLSLRVRAYLHVNCAHCHRRGGGGTASLELLHTLPLEQTHMIGEPPTQGTFGILDARVVAPGDPYRSVLLYRLAKVGHGHMPRFGARTIDRHAVRMIHDWIAELPPLETADDAAAGNAAGDSQSGGGGKARNGAGRGDAGPRRPSVGTPAVDGTAVARRGVETGGSVVDLVANLRHRQRVWLQTLRTAPPDDARFAAATERLFATTSGALWTLCEIEAGAFSPPASRAIVERGATHPEATVRDLFERFLPPSRRTRRLGTDVSVEELLTLQGDAASGRRLFFESKLLQCRNCHRLDGRGRALGPDLDGLAKRLSRREIVQAVLLPSLRVDEKYRVWSAQTADGRVLNGLLRERTAQRVQLVQADGREVTLAADEIELLVPQPKSLMPELQLKDLTRQQAADLLAFLFSLSDSTARPSRR